MNSKNIGDFGEYRIIDKLFEYGVPVYKSLGDNLPNDILIEIDKKFYRIQIKTSNVVTKNTNAVSYHLFSQPHRGKERHIYTKDEVDYFILYSIRYDEIVIIENTGKKEAISIRYTEPKGGDRSVMNFAKDLSLDNFLRSKGFNSIFD